MVAGASVRWLFGRAERASGAVWLTSFLCPCRDVPTGEQRRRRQPWYLPLPSRSRMIFETTTEPTPSDWKGDTKADRQLGVRWEVFGPVGEAAADRLFSARRLEWRGSGVRIRSSRGTCLCRPPSPRFWRKTVSVSGMSQHHHHAAQ